MVYLLPQVSVNAPPAGNHVDFDRLYQELVELAKSMGGVLLTVDPDTCVIRSVTFSREFRWVDGRAGKGLLQGRAAGGQPEPGT